AVGPRKIAGVPPTVEVKPSGAEVKPKTLLLNQASRVVLGQFAGHVFELLPSCRRTRFSVGIDVATALEQILVVKECAIVHVSRNGVSTATPGYRILVNHFIPARLVIVLGAHRVRIATLGIARQEIIQPGECAPSR